MLGAGSWKSEVGRPKKREDVHFPLRKGGVRGIEKCWVWMLGVGCLMSDVG